MNYRIEELAKKALEIVSNERTLPDGQIERTWNPKRYDEVFAELIVGECINEVEGLQVSQSTLDWSQHWNRAIAHTSLHLKEHFGVEE